MLLSAVFMCLLLRSGSSAPLTSDSDSSSASSSDEDLQLPAVFPVVGGAYHNAPPMVPEAPPSVIVKVEGSKTNTTLSFAIFILAEEEGSGADGGGRSDENSSSSEDNDIIDDTSSEETNKQDIQPMASLLPSSQPMKKVQPEYNLSSEEMMSDQPMFSDEEADDFNNTFRLTLSDDFDAFIDFNDFFNSPTESNVIQKLTDDFNNSTESTEVYNQPTVTVSDYCDDKNNTRSDDFSNDANRKETADPTSPLSDDFNNSTESTEINDQRTIFDSFHNKNTRSDEPALSLFDDSLSSEVTELNQNLQGLTLNPDNQQQMFGTNTVDKLALDPVSQEVTSSSSEKTSSANQDRLGSSRGSISKDFGLGSGLKQVFRSIQEAVDLFSGNQGLIGVKGSHQEVLGSSPIPLTGSQTGFSLSSDESSEMFSEVSSDANNQTGYSSDPDSDESLENTSIQKGTGSKDSTLQVSGPITNLIPDSIKPDPNNKEVLDTSVGSFQADEAARLQPVSSDQGGAPTIWSVPKGTMSQDSARSSSQVGVSLTSDSSEESQESVVGSTSGPGLSSVQSSEVSSSSEEVVLAHASSSAPLLVSSPVLSTQTPAEFESFSSESQDSDLSATGSKSDFPELGSGGDSESTELHPDPLPTSGSNLSPGSNYNPSFRISSEVSQGESEESPTIKVPTDANSDGSRGANPSADYNNASIAASSEASMDAKLDTDVKDTTADLILEATTDSSNDVSIDAVYSTSLPTMHVSSGASTDANTDAGSELSVEEDDNASTDRQTAESAVSKQPTATTEYKTSPPDSRVSTDAITNVEKEQVGADVSTEAKLDVNSHSEESMSSPLPPPPPLSPPSPPPCRKRPYRFGFLGPIVHSYGNQPVDKETLAVQLHHNQNVYSNPLRGLFNSQYDADRERHQLAITHQSSRKQTGVSVAVVANPAQSSSEETN